MAAALEGGERSAARACHTLSPVKTRYPFYRSLGGPQVRSGRAELLVLTGIRSRIFQPVAQSLYRLSYPPHICNIVRVNFHAVSIVSPPIFTAQNNSHSPLNTCHVKSVLLFSTSAAEHTLTLIVLMWRIG